MLKLREELVIFRRKAGDPEWAQEFFDACVEDALTGDPDEYELSRYLVREIWGRKRLADFERVLAESGF